jgi:hypothetical protein
MTQISTSLRTTRESARYIRYEPTAPLTATNVQDAIGQAGITIGTTAINSGTSSYTPSNSDRVLLVDTAGGPITISLQIHTARAGLELTIKDDTGHASTNAISLVGNGGETIDGLGTYPIDTDFGRVTIAPQAGGYFVKS